MQRIVVNDINVFIDLLDIGLLDHFFQLSWEVHTTDFVIIPGFQTPIICIKYQFSKFYRK